ncbi:alcohol dehydrogenase [Alicycliphilus denitrificans]|uniref:zinc-dependent alcohol dehydrogenase family protein n=1 Tax=Alicycliphilus denitrificans TaxID=179636 RepID=UPI0009629D92|nr:zinc-dependent alcohol dehydrogenase family protein [Alicycliphilus denitrificans]MBN9574002.1 zinc-dependent alcohol dehydrogenase family protein [Alicycliphilus denitrificans]OJW89058.1 MAG: alcohol dehydrogenase [Alicycliphilus sp. 69-12]BCN40833.1 alcohol dehydrogenase [Alicycliphilus denitrificans]
MRAMVLEQPGRPLRLAELPQPVPGEGQLLLAVEACGVCRTDLHLLDGELPDPVLPVVPGHEIVARVAGLGPDVQGWRLGQRVGVPWLGWTCGQCRFCTSGRENLCDRARFTGYQLNGGYAEYTLADARYCLALPEEPAAEHLAPLLCAGLIGYRALRLAGDPQRLGVYGFGAAAHLITQLARAQGREVFAFTRPGDGASQEFARSLGANWAAGTDEAPPQPLDAALIFAPAGPLVPIALRHLDKGGCVVCAGIHMSDIPGFPYAWLWGERSIRSVANLTREDGLAFFEAVRQAPLRTEVSVFALEQANEALERLRQGALQGAAVLRM